MDNLRKLTIIIIRLNAMTFVVAGFIHLVMFAGMMLFAILQFASSIPTSSYAYAIYALTGLAYFLAAVVLYAVSRPLANYFVEAVERSTNEPTSKPPPPPEFN